MEKDGYQEYSWGYGMTTLNLNYKNYNLMAQRNENSYRNKFSNKRYNYDNMKYILLAQHTHEELI